MTTPEACGIVPRHRRTGVEQRLPCPVCDRGSRDQALALRLLDDGGFRAFCHRCGSRWGAKPRRLDMSQAGGRRRVPAPAASSERDDNRTRDTLVPGSLRYWSRLWPVPGTLAETYLRARCCALPPRDGDLRFDPRALHWPSRREAPAMVALASDAVDRRPRTLHFTFLAPDGSGKADLQPPRLLLGRHSKAGAVVRLWPDEAVTLGLGVAEGIETALSLAWCGLPVWACIDGGNLAAFPVLEGVESLAIAVDRDPAGEKAAHGLAHRWVTAGREVRLVMPKAGDLNDIAQGTYVVD